ncbi:hypothetical protein niasHT_018974 [Heterodera trifolii]|uniref:Uncharacterized protein n=1 Tax=Heterodera trifolii TaxID=157864 RepID=A0ABD2LDX8_9BILA
MGNSSAEARRMRKEWRQEHARKAGSTPKRPQHTTAAPSTTGEGTSAETMSSTSNAEHRRRSNPRPLSTTPIRRHARVRPTTVHKETSTDFRAAVQSTQTVLETVDCSTQTETELASIQKLCAELNKAKRRIATLGRQLQKKTEEVNMLKKRPAVENKGKLKRVTEKRKLQEIMAKSGAIRHAKTQEYTGDQMKRLILASTEIRSIGTPFSSDIADLLDEIRELHIFGRADLLTPEQIDNFSNKCSSIQGYFKNLWETHPTKFDTNNAAGFTPKLHWLLAHAPDFAKRWGWFAWISEQGIEHLHHVLNKQSERFKRYKGDELLLKIGEHQTLLNSIFDRHIGLF